MEFMKKNHEEFTKDSSTATNKENLPDSVERGRSSW